MTTNPGIFIIVFIIIIVLKIVFMYYEIQKHYFSYIKTVLTSFVTHILLMVILSVQMSKKEL